MNHSKTVGIFKIFMLAIVILITVITPWILTVT